MPYIQQEIRYALDQGGLPQTPGDLNYCITKAVLRYMEQKDLNYNLINDIVGAIEGAKLEFYRRVAVPYEQKKIAANGDLYE